MSLCLIAWFPYGCICRVCRTKKIHRTDITLWKPPVQMLNTKETTYTTFCTRMNEFHLSYDFFSYDRHDRYDRYNHMETRLMIDASIHKLPWSINSLLLECNHRQSSMLLILFACFFFFISYFRGLLAKTQREPFKESRAKCSGPKILLCVMLAPTF